MRPVSIIALALVMASSAFADSTWNGGFLLDATRVNQLAGWLNQGELDLNLIWRRNANPDYPLVANFDFHYYVDGQGPTFSIFSTNLGLVGGYNPQSWNNDMVNHITPALADRTAFLFNFDTNKKYRQFTSLQTYNGPNHGPCFGAGFDLCAQFSGLDFAMAMNDSYRYGFTVENVFGVSGAGTASFDVYDIEVYTFQTRPPSAVPEPGSAALLLGAIGAMVGLKRFRRR